MLLLLPWCPESPRFLMLVTKDEDEAEKGERAKRLIKDICIAQGLFQQHHGLSVLRQTVYFIYGLLIVNDYEVLIPPSCIGSIFHLKLVYLLLESLLKSEDIK